MNNLYLTEEDYKQTTDWWYNNYFINGLEQYVKIKLIIANPRNIADIEVRGTEDYGMILHFHKDYNQAIKMYNELKNLKFINKKTLIEKGFQLL